MKNLKAKQPIGIFDSGIGGISVLSEIIKILPHEEFIYFADTLHAPYGTKSEDMVQSLAIKATEFLSSVGIKSLVIACNTATSAAVDTIRKSYTFPVIGMEPAVKPATNLGLRGKIIVMATPLTLMSKKFSNLIHHYKNQAEIIPFPCGGLVELVEHDYLRRQEIKNYLSNLFSSVNKESVSTIVLGCTHYVLIKREIAAILDNTITIIDGNYGTARHLKTILQNENLLNNGFVSENPRIPIRANIKFYASGDEKEIIIKCKHLLENEGIICE